MIFDFIDDVDAITFRLKCAIQSLHVLHTSADEDGGANWEMHCNALYSILLQLYGIQGEQEEALKKAIAENRKQNGKTPSK